MRYRKKSEIIEAVKWDGKLETIKNNKWLEDAIKEDKIMLGMNDIYDKEPVLLREDEWSDGFIKVDIGTYIIKGYINKTNEDYKIGVMDSENFERKIELINESLSEVDKELSVNVCLDVEEGMKSIFKFKEEVIGCTKLCKSRNIDAVNEILIMQSNYKISESLEQLEQGLSKKIGKKVVILPSQLSIIGTVVNK